MICAQCKAEQPDGNRFCGQCGASLAARPQAPAAPPRVERPPVPAAPARRAGERRQMTMLFYDLVGSTALATRCDPEDFSEAMETFHSRIGTAIRGVGGHVGARVGDGAVVYFGYPDAQEDAAERAVLAGLRAVEVGGEVVLPDGEKAQVRIGIATGQGVVSRLEHDGAGNEVVGSVGNLAARLQSAAGPGNVVISDATRRLLRDRFELVDLGGVEAKGFSEPVRAWRVAGLAERDPAEGVGEAPLIGRAEPLAKIAAALEATREGSGRVILLSGDAGMGKSRLVAEVARRAGAEGVLRMSVLCSAQLQEAPFGPFIQQMQRANRIVGAREGASIAPSAAPHGMAPGTDPDDAALLGGLFGFSLPESAALQVLTPAQKRDRRIEALIHQLALFSKLSPVLLVVEDAQWADATSRSVLDRAVHAGRLDRTLILITARTGFRPSWLAETHVEEIMLAPLDPVEAEALIYMTAGFHALTPSVGRAIRDRADGVPLFLEEITRSAMEARAGVDADDNLPATLQDTLLARLDRLGPAKAAAQIAAVIGRRFTRALLERLLDSDVGDPASALRRLLASGLIAHDRSGAADSYVFKHALFQETAYGTLLRVDRRRLNARLLEIIEREQPEVAAAEPDRLAHYASEAGAHEAAGGYWLKAGLQVMAQWAMPEAAARLRRGLAAVAQLPQEPGRWRLELRLELSLGRARIATVGYALPETGATFVRAKALCEAIGQRVELAAVVHGLWIHDLLCGRLDSARLHAQTLLRMAEEDDNPSWVLVAYRALGALGFPSGQFADGERNLKYGLSLFSMERRAEYAQILVDDPRVVMLMYLSWVLLYQGRKEEALEAVTECVGQARALGQAYNMAYALVGQVMVGLFQDDYDGLAPVIQELIVLAREQEIDYFAAVGEVSRGRYLVGVGEIQSGARVIEAALETYRATGSILYLPSFMLWTSDAVARVGRIDRAMELIVEARTLMERTGMANDLAEVHRVEGELHRRRGDRVLARAAFEAALETVDRYGAELHRGRALASLAALDRDEPCALGYGAAETVR